MFLNMSMHVKAYLDLSSKSLWFVVLLLGPCTWKLGRKGFFARAPFGSGGLVAECVEPWSVYHVTTRALDQRGVEPRLAVSLRSEGHRQYYYTTAPAFLVAVADRALFAVCLFLVRLL